MSAFPIQDRPASGREACLGFCFLFSLAQPTFPPPPLPHSDDVYRYAKLALNAWDHSVTKPQEVEDLKHAIAEQFVVALHEDEVLLERKNRTKMQRVCRRMRLFFCFMAGRILATYSRINLRGYAATPPPSPLSPEGYPLHTSCHRVAVVSHHSSRGGLCNRVADHNVSAAERGVEPAIYVAGVTVRINRAGRRVPDQCYAPNDRSDHHEDRKGQN